MCFIPNPSSITVAGTCFLFDSDWLATAFPSFSHGIAPCFLARSIFYHMLYLFSLHVRWHPERIKQPVIQHHRCPVNVRTQYHIHRRTCKQCHFRSQVATGCAFDSSAFDRNGLPFFWTAPQQFAPQLFRPNSVDHKPFLTHFDQRHLWTNFPGIVVLIDHLLYFSIPFFVPNNLCNRFHLSKLLFFPKNQNNWFGMFTLTFNLNCTLHVITYLNRF